MSFLIFSIFRFDFVSIEGKLLSAPQEPRKVSFYSLATSKQRRAKKIGKFQLVMHQEIA